jgi:hypothetical protein
MTTASLNSITFHMALDEPITLPAETWSASPCAPSDPLIDDRSLVLKDFIVELGTQPNRKFAMTVWGNVVRRPEERNRLRQPGPVPLQAGISMPESLEETLLAAFHDAVPNANEVWGDEDA